MIFLETSFIINLNVQKVQNHERAKKINNIIKNKKKIISEMVIYETLTVLRKLKQNDDTIKGVYDSLINSEDIEVLEDIIYYEPALEDTIINNTIGFFDNLSHIVMINNDIKEIASFDPDFDIFSDIKRIY
jgi:predicted nucleic acid-binding protein